MGSHHFIGTGRLGPWLEEHAADEGRLLAEGRGLVERSGLKVVGENAVAFEGGGATLVWILAESHLVLHVWEAEGFATLDLHVCDYQSSNKDKARKLVRGLTERLFEPGSEHWRELEVEHPASAPVAG